MYSYQSIFRASRSSILAACVQGSIPSRSRQCISVSRASLRLRSYSTPPPDNADSLPSLKRSYLYVPASSDRMLEKSLTSPSDVIIYDLEDSVPPSVLDKESARNRLKDFLHVCVNYKDLDYLKDECADGRRLGFTGKQAIHPSQVEVIQSTFVPSSKGAPLEILRAARILRRMEIAHNEQRGAAGLETEDGGKEMIDAPMIKQAENTIRVAMAAGIDIPNVD
ncbi:hypothetical protein PHLCEN_2v3562 [Hermanssonia centrifuga]|uniref:HpcH/HpaI aldolase/citrate lyase domain-containing protein n=1 Tax=Hermanssonia centrifuga TaxID=98765 RepID=A0A2R6QEW0_9APHY|nr:hypothetical protein PHLCEN_2v3562 [Hermanssonia centrifuga]